MNRLILIGNGFDLAHSLKTGYKDFINWYWTKWYEKLRSSEKSYEDDELCSFELKLQRSSWYIHLSQRIKFSERQYSGIDFIKLIIKESPEIYELIKCPLLENITQSIETKGWVDIENEYYHLLTEYTKETYQEENVKKLNKHLEFLRKKLIEYLKEVDLQDTNFIEEINTKIYEPFKEEDIAIKNQEDLKRHAITWWRKNLQEWTYRKDEYNGYNINLNNVINKPSGAQSSSMSIKDFKEEHLLPNNVLLLNFNYTNTILLYKTNASSTNYIHGKLEEPKGVIFGYGDELDESYNHIKRLNNNELLSNFKSSKYLESDRYRKLLQFIESAPFQVCIMGHSCGNSDRTLLNTIFEHDNCVSIKPYYYEQGDGNDNYLDIIHNISRNFTDMKKMRDRVVNKTYCEPLVRPKIKK